jgi:hypothetical protein
MSWGSRRYENPQSNEIQLTDPVLGIVRIRVGVLRTKVVE